ncbi:MAG: hypothetical protein JETT_3969 [Candidatus Jettenia ecosi]|uniref:Uncharacterized protein n=1 Tax=Candidatus Jettenia ecosi TaxID=2494326 RepID=A0A533Q5F1_9BACT|nr:MAG: hypothetical protein JETT_3969 [Candidatus Jettenia ecosi]
MAEKRRKDRIESDPRQNRPKLFRSVEPSKQGVSSFSSRVAESRNDN